ncbi:tetratricopeptide repeat protein [Nostoc sp. FACHB-87]|uniref:toll/interleukin-1 receptor domain-containing protein n=1 Tax=Nostocaceae TaxID=1162 RepID=UPI0016864B3A|nr:MULTISPECIES: tetratricopeptide repeat protein [Nostocaceae]MBD2453671.1 tetratricopeptide repeat protein [Nostoc sp. FACHB-87]MBD2475374.1 tetratricopeptide repeat protein [Anabaena sp. FACHB-83]
MSKQFHVFLAHHSADKPLVREIATKLKQRGFKPWIDEEQIPPGRSFQQAIQQAIDTVETAAIILGKDGVGRWQEWEIETFFSRCVENKMIVIPVLLPGVDEVPEKLPFLRNLRWINFDSLDDINALGLLIWGITGEKPEEELKESSPSETSTEKIQPSSFDADTYFNQGLAKYNLRDKQGAISDFNQAIQIKPDFALAYIGRGVAKSDLGDKQGAISDYNQAIHIKSDFAAAYYLRGIAKSDLGDNQGAISDYNQAIQIQPDDADAYNNRGLAKSELGDKQGAISDYNQAIQIKLDFAQAYINRGVAKYLLGDKQGAIADFNQAAQLYSQQNKMSDYQDALDRVKKLEKSFWERLFS